MANTEHEPINENVPEVQDLFGEDFYKLSVRFDKEGVIIGFPHSGGRYKTWFYTKPDNDLYIGVKLAHVAEPTLVPNILEQLDTYSQEHELTHKQHEQLTLARNRLTVLITP